jgi:hypothetical protein
MQCPSRLLVLCAIALPLVSSAAAQDVPGPNVVKPLAPLPLPDDAGESVFPPAAPGVVESQEAPMFVPMQPGPYEEETHWHGEPLPGALPHPITDEFCGACCEVSCDDCCECGWWTRCCCWCRGCCSCCYSTCDMYPHYAYFPAHHGYYYMRPYNHQLVAVQRDWVVQFGGDARAPYSNEYLKDRFANLDIPGRPDNKIRSRQLPSLPSLADDLPDLQELLNAPEEAPPTPGDLD